MKYGVIDFNKTVKSYWEKEWNRKALLNIGDAAEYLVVEQLLDSIGIGKEEMHYISIRELQSYSGETLIVPMNIALDSYVGYNTILEKLSPDIIPVFLGMSFTDTNLNDKQIECLKKFSPVGCRDERSYLLLKSYDIPCYLNGCTASVIDLGFAKNDKWKDKIVFIDVPYAAISSIPEGMKKEIVFANQEIYCNEAMMKDNLTPSDWARRIFEIYAGKPKLIVSSRFHAAVLAMANDIPAIVTLEKYTFRFSWIKNYYPLHTEIDFSKIEWNNACRAVDFSEQREKILNAARLRIQNVVFENFGMEELTKMQKARNKENEAVISNQTLYYRRVWEEIQHRWNENSKYKFGFWGLNDNAEILYKLINQKYPTAQLVSIYDMFKESEYRGIKSEHPNKLERFKDDPTFFVIVTAYLASRVAEDVFNEIGYPNKQAFLCRRDFITKEDFSEN